MTRFALWLIAVVTPRSDRDSIVCDTVERFDELRHDVNPRHARRWLWRETVRVIWNAPRHHVAVTRIHARQLGNHLEARMASGRGIGKWFVLGLAAAGAVTGYVVSGISPEYRSEATLQVVLPRVSDDLVALPSAGRLDERLLTIQRTVLSRTRLERLIADFNLYQADRKSGMAMQDIVEKMRRRIGVDVGPGLSADRTGVFVVSFSHPEPRRAQQVTETLAGFFITEHQRDTERRAENNAAFVKSQVEDAGRRMMDVTERLAQARSGPDAARFQIEVEVIRENYRALLAKREQSLMHASLERYRIGETLALLDFARIPERPVGPTRNAAAVAGGLAGLAIALMVGLFLSVRQAIAARTTAAAQT